MPKLFNRPCTRLPTPARRHAPALALALAAVLMAPSAPAQTTSRAPAGIDAATAATMPRYTLREDTAPVGSNIPRAVMRDSLLPFNLGWQELSPAQRLVMKSHYETMADNDEPPFPKAGLRAIYDAMNKVARRTGDRGPVRLDLTIDSDGQVASVAVITSPSAGFTQGMAREMLEVPFKPAVCAGQPCRMAFPVRADLQRRLQ